MSRNKCCVPGCQVVKDDGIPLHRFPDPKSNLEKYMTWVLAIGGLHLLQDKKYVYNNMRVCRKHFRAVYLYPNHQLCKLAIPELQLSAQERERAPENLPSTSALQAQLIMDVDTQKEQQGSCENLPLNMDVDIPLEQHGIREHHPSTLRCMHQTSMGPLHRFPKWEYPHTEKFNHWKSVLDNTTQERGNNYIYNSIRICHKHFEEYFKSSSRRLTRNAVPTLNLKADKTENMAIVEDEVRNGSEEENEIEVVVDEDDGDQDSDDSDDEDDEEALEKKVSDLEQRIAENPYNYNDHIDLIRALWSLSELDRWRAAFDRLQEMSLLRPEHWLLRLQTEATLAHSPEDRERLADLFQQATLDCYSIPILTEWCSWALGADEAGAARAQLDEVLRRAGADPLSGKIFWDARLELEKAKLDTMSSSEEGYGGQRERVLWALEEAVSRPLLRGEDAWPQLVQVALAVRDQDYVDKVKKQHEAAVEYLQKITPYEDKLLTLEDPEEKIKVYLEYIEEVKDLSKAEKYAECDSDGILRVLYERATTECPERGEAGPLLTALARLAQRRSSRAGVARALALCTRRCPRRAAFWLLRMQHAERAASSFDEVKSIFETALSKGMESFAQAEALWLGWLEYTRRRTSFDDGSHVERLRDTCRLAWDSLAQAWGEEANDCEVPLFWARLEYKRIKEPAQGKEIFEEIFKYGENKTLSKYWEALIHLEMSRDPPASERKLRDLHRRALRSVTDYPPAVARLWTDYERDYGELATSVECAQLCEEKLKEWRESYQAMKEKMMGQKQKGKQAANKKSKFDNKNKKDEKSNKGKRKSDSGPLTSEASDVKKKKDNNMEVDVPDKEGDTGGGVKRSHDEVDETGAESKRQRKDSSTDTVTAGREACTLFVSNLEFKVNEQNLRDKLSEYGDIVSLRVKAGVKAFGGSICYCQYKSPESVEKALKHDRTPLDGRPMFLSRYSSKKSKPTFKYPLIAENNKLFVKNLPYSHCTKDALTDIFDKFGKLKDVRIVTFKDGKPKGLAYVDYEDESSAAEAIKNTNGLMVGDRKIEVAISAPPPKQEPSTSTLGLPKRDTGGGMRRTQLSSFIPRVLQQAASTSKASNGNQSNGDTKRPLTNADFKNMLLNK